MFFEQLYLGCLSQASYVIGDETTGRAVVVDPRRDVDIYVQTADAHGLTIERIIETHVHADFVSGHLELADRTGAPISYGEAIGETGFPVERLAHGQRLELGDVIIEVRSTPGHTPESISLVVYESRDAAPYGVLTGDTLLLGGVGRPDLSTALADDAPRLARRLYASLRDEILSLPDPTLVFPAHGPGSACGKNLSNETISTIGEQRRTNEALQSTTEDAFVASVTCDQPVTPGYFPFDARRNREARPLLDAITPAELTAAQLESLVEDGAVVLDTREPDHFAAAHLPRAINVSLQGRFAEQAGMVLEPGRRVVVTGEPGTASEAKVRLARIGFDRVVGSWPDPAARSRRTGPATLRRLTVRELELRIRDPDELLLVDVRTPAETACGVIPGARHLPLARLMSRIDELVTGVPVVVYCAGGRRSATAASVLSAAGVADVADLVGGFDAWSANASPESRGPKSLYSR